MEKKKGRKKAASQGRRQNWQEYTASVEDIQNFLKDRVVLRYNVITRRVEYRAPMSSPVGDTIDGEGTIEAPSGAVWGALWQPLTDRIVNSLWAELSATKRVRAPDIFRVMDSDFVPEFNPFSFYLERLPRWDGKRDCIMELSLSVNVKGGTDEQLLFSEYLKKWLVGMVAAWIDPQVVNNVILVLIGEQGSYKTTWFNYLLPPELRRYFYTKTNANRMGRDDLLTLAQYGLVCCEELDTMRPSELNQLKAAVTMPSIDERAAYAHYHEHRQHIASFCGTGNNTQFLSDPTGNRRWLPFEVESIDSPRDHPFDYEGIYAQAYQLYQQGFQYWFSRAEIDRLSQHNDQFETPKLEKELVDVYFRRPTGQEPGEYMPVSRALQIVGGNTVQQLSAVRLGRAFLEQGFQQVRRAHSRGYIVVRRSAEEIQSHLHGTAYSSSDEAI